MLTSADERDRDSQGLDSRRLWSLWDLMIDFHLRSFIDALADLNIAQTRARMAVPDEFVSSEQLALIGDSLARIKSECVNLDLPISKVRLGRLGMLFAPSACSTNGCLSHEIDELFNAIEIDARGQYFCHYRSDRVPFLLKIETEWSAAFDAFPYVKAEIIAGVDCYALGHNTACVFHMARVGEMGLRLIAQERGIKALKGKKGVPIPVEWATWGQVFGAMEPTIREIKQKPNGAQRDAALKFYETIVSDLHAIQSLYRDQTMHLREDYDDGQAQSAMFRVRELMNTLASKLDGDRPKAIPWGAWK